MAPRNPLRLSADVGGTFTDVAAFDETTGELRLGKTLTTPQRLVTGIEHGVDKAGSRFAAARLFLHGTTVAINTILERSGAHCALLTTLGFRDIYEIGRVNRPESYNLFFRKHDPLIDRDLRFEIMERMDAQGTVLIKLDEDQVRAAAAEAVRQGVQAIAILFLHSYRNPAHEQRAKAIIEQEFPQLFVTASHELSQEYREYERTSTAAANAYVGPRVRQYLTEMESHLDDGGFAGNFLIVQSTGGLFDAADARSACIRMLESGPAAGVVGSKALCDQIGLKNAIAFDMGGTTAKAGVIFEGTVLMTGSALIGGYATGLPVQIPMIDIQEVGTGGGSIARVELGNALRVGPESAGAVPGPVCYGLGGTEPTFTDAMVATGYLNPAALAGGRVALDAGAALAALEERIARPLGLSLADAAYGIYQIAASTMTRAVKAVTTYRGRDPRDFALIAFGGNGPVAAAAIARALAIRTVLVPPAPGVFSALGLLTSAVEHEHSASVLRRVDELDDAALEAAFAALEARALAALAAEGHDPAQVRIKRSAELRYSGQAYELAVPAASGDTLAGVAARFHDEHRRTYGHSSPGDPVDVVSVRVWAQAGLPEGALDYARLSAAAGGRHAAPAAGSRRAYFGRDTGFVDTPVVGRAALGSEWRAGPLIVEEYDATCVIPPGARARLDALGNIEIDVPPEDA